MSDMTNLSKVYYLLIHYLQRSSDQCVYNLDMCILLNNSLKIKEFCNPNTKFYNIVHYNKFTI